MQSLYSLDNYLDKLSLPAIISGFSVIVVYNLYLWHRDKQILKQRADLPSLPSLEQWPRLPLVSALVAAWNEADYIQAHIESFQRMRYPNKELVLVAGGQDDTLALAKQYTKKDVLILEQLPGEGKQRALRRGLEHIDGDIVYFTDADCLFDEDSFESTVYPLVCGAEAAVSGTSRPSLCQFQHPFIASQAASQLYGAYHSPVYAPGLMGRNCAITRSALASSGALDARAPTGTDYVLAKILTRAGVRIRQVPESQVVSKFPTSFTAYFRQQLRWMWNVWDFGRRLGAPAESSKMVRNAAVGLGMLSLPALSLFIGPFLLAAWSLFFFSGCLARLRYMDFLSGLHSEVRPSGYFVRVPVYLLLDLAVWASALLYITGVLQRRGW
jgi:cellulose synthase/poly-beta-1,6-N-acetylglucosamine synthase-like glycosyltransferase